jgi:hypothetical protein
MYGLQREEGDRLTWDAATKKLASGGCAFESMNDSAFGELIAAGAKESRDFGATTFPGTGDSFLAVVDVFVAATKARNAKNALAFLGAISTPATQIACNTSKGSIPVVRDVDDEPGVPRRLLRRGIDVRPDTERGRVRRRPRGSGLRGQDSPTLRLGTTGNRPVASHARRRTVVRSYAAHNSSSHARPSALT